MLAQSLFVCLLGCHLAFQWIIHMVNKTQKTAESTRKTVAAEDISHLHGVFRELISLRDTVKELDCDPSTFTKHALANRKLISTDRQWKAIYDQMSAQERLPYIEVLRKRGELKKNSVATGTSLFAQAMNPELQGSERQDFYASLLEKLGGGVGDDRFKTLKTLIAPLKILTTWILVHALVGWSPRISQLPLYHFPASMLRPLVGADGTPSFFTSQLLSQVQTASLKNYVIPWNLVLSETNLLAAPLVCRSYSTFGWMGSTFLIGTAVQHLYKELFTKKGCVWRAWTGK